jgi:hypothetical protein
MDHLADDVLPNLIDRLSAEKTQNITPRAHLKI